MKEEKKNKQLEPIDNKHNGEKTVVKLDQDM